MKSIATETNDRDSSARKVDGVVVFCFEANGHQKAKRLSGVFAFARKAGWNVQVINPSFHGRDDVRRLVRFWNPSGFIVDGWAGGVPEPKFFGGRPVVFCDVIPEVCGAAKWAKAAGFVRHDSKASVRCAVRELAKFGRANFAYVGNYEPCYWSEEREAAFRELTRRSAKTFSSFVWEKERPFTDAVDFLTRLREWLVALPKPCALLAVNDAMGVQVLGLCRTLGIRVPEQIAVAGIDNDEVFCENASPTLSSVEPDFRAAGFASAALLDEMLSGKSSGGATHAFGPSGLVSRASTQFVREPNRKVMKALELIRREACGGLTANDVLARLGGSRRSAEMLFRSVAGCSVLEKIEEARLAEAQRLLRDTKMKIAAVANACGYSSPTFLRDKFRRAFGVSMKDWRGQLRGGDRPCQGADDVVGLAGVEPATYGLGNRRSVQLSYNPKR